MRDNRVRKLVFLFVATGISAWMAHATDTKKLKAAPKEANSSGPRIAINRPFRQDMADSAGLDPKDPTLSADGLHSLKDGTKKLASSECLFAETLVQATNNITPHSVAEYCEQTGTDQATRFENALTHPDDKSATTMDEALIHLVVWDKGQWTGTWYQYERSSKKGRGILIPLGRVGAVTSPPNHLLARGGLGFLAIHLNIDDSCDITYDVKATHTRPLNQQDFIDLVSLAESTATKAKGAGKGGATPTSKSIGIWGGQLLIGGIKTPATIVFSPSIKQGLSVEPAGQNDTWDVGNTCKSTTKPADNEAKAASSSTGDTGQIMRVASSPMGPRQKSSDNPTLKLTSLTLPAHDDVPEDFSVTFDSQQDTSQKAEKNPPTPDKPAAASNNQLSGGSLTIPDEGFYWWDVSVAMPVTSYNRLNYSSVNNILVVKNTNDIKPYALFDIYLGRTDLRLNNAISLPLFAFGIPMSGQPLQKPFVGTGFTVAIKGFHFQPLVGLRIEKDLRTNLAAGSPVTPLQLVQSEYTEWHAKFQAMIGFSVTDAAKLLGIKK